MTDRYDFLMDAGGPHNSSDSALLGAPHGYCVWQWTNSGWAVEQDASTETGIPRQPDMPGSFVGQLRAVICFPKGLA